MLRALTSQNQRQLARRNFSLMVGDRREVQTTEESGSEYEFPPELAPTSVHKSLINSLRKKTWNQPPERPQEVDLQISGGGLVDMTAIELGDPAETMN